MLSSSFRTRAISPSQPETKWLKCMIALDSHKTRCPNCGEMVVLVIDCSVEQQEYIEDCQVCCRPILINVQVHRKDFEVSVRNLDE